MRDPIHTFLFQPAVDLLQVDPRRTAVSVADAFLLIALTLSAIRVATRGDLFGSQVMHIVGAAIVFGWMRFSASNGLVARTGPFGMIHLAMRAMFLVCLTLDVREVHVLLSTDLMVTPASLGRSLLQLCEDVLALVSIYLSLCDMPKPRSRGRKVVMAGA